MHIVISNYRRCWVLGEKQLGGFEDDTAKSYCNKGFNRESTDCGVAALQFQKH